MLYIVAGNQNADYENVPQYMKDEREKMFKMFYEEGNEEVEEADQTK